MLLPPPVVNLKPHCETNHSTHEQFWKPLAPFIIASGITYFGVAKAQEMGVNTPEALANVSFLSFFLALLFLYSSFSVSPAGWAWFSLRRRGIYM